VPQTPERRREYMRGYMRQYRVDHPEWKAYNADRMRRYRRQRKQDKALLMSTSLFNLHELKCPPPPAACRCRVLVVLP
jgi:hypothetical protein